MLRSYLLLALATLAATTMDLGSHAGSPDGSVCSVIIWWGGVSERVTFFVGEAEPDTLGDLQPPRYEKIRQSLHHPSVFGQVFRPTRIGGFEADSLRALMPADDRRFVLVPWGLSAGCGYSQWRHSFQWIPPGRKVFIWAGLRDEARWIEGNPTFDLKPLGVQPHPFQSDPPVYFRVEFEDQLTPDEMFSLFSVLPTDAELRESPESAVAPVVHWQRDNVEASTHYPAYLLLSQLHRRRAEARATAAPNPIAGSYDLTLTVERRAPILLEIDIREKPYRAVLEGGRFEYEKHPTPPAEPATIGYDVLARMRSTAAEEADLCSLQIRVDPPAGEWTAASSDGPWPAGIRPDLLQPCFREDSLFVEIAEAFRDAPREGDEWVSQGSFLFEGSGGAYFTQTISLPGLPTVELEAHRVQARAEPQR